MTKSNACGKMKKNIRSKTMLYSFIPFEYLSIIAIIAVPLLSFVLIKGFAKKLATDRGKEFDVPQGELSRGKITGAGIFFVIAYIIGSLLFVPVSIEYSIYYALIFIEMMSGFLDDCAKIPWGEYKKGLIDLVVSALMSLTFVHYNPELLNISIFGFSFGVNKIIYVILGAILVWLMINAVNCCDGIDGYSSVLSIIAYASCCVVIVINKGDTKAIFATVLMTLVLLPYLWYNANPSTILMGDAGSRALGLLLALLLMKTGNALLVIPLCALIIVDGLLGIVKVSVIRFFHIKGFMKNIRTPIHDHLRKNKNWSNTQVIYRLSILQLIISAVTILGVITLK